MATFNFSLPTIDYASMSNQDYIKKVANNLAVLTEELQYTLNNLEISNMTDSTAEWLKKIGGSSITVTDEMIEIISQTINIVADNIHLEGYTTINGGAWFDLEGNFGAKNGTFNGSIIGGLIQSLNYIVRDASGAPVLDANGKQQETGEGTYINLDESYAIFKGITNYAWLGELAAYHSMSTEIDNGRLVFTDLTNNNKKLWFSYEGISTTEDGSDAVGVIDFRSNLFNSEDTNYQGITLVGYGSPVGILVHRGVCVISPAADQAVYDVTNMLSDKFIFDVNKRYAQTGSVIDYNTPFVSEFRDGEGVIAFSEYAWDGTTRHNHVALLFSKDTDNPYLKATNGTQTALVPIYASNINECLTKTYTNTKAYSIGSSYKQIISINTTAGAAASTGAFTAQILTDVTCDTTAVMYFKYWLNDVENIVWVPAQTVSTGKHIITLYYPLSLMPSTDNKIVVKASISSGSVEIAIENIKAGVTAYAISGDEPAWDGRISVDDSISKYTVVSGVKISELTANVIMNNQEPSSPAINQNITPVILGGVVISGLETSITIT